MVRCNGYTLSELMLSLLILSILLAMTLPNFSQFSAKVQLESTMNRLETSLRMAHSLTKTGMPKVTVCASTNSTTCSGSNTWEKGWIVQYQEAGGNVVIVQVFGEQSTGVTLRATGFSDNSTINLVPLVALRNQFEEGTFTGCLQGALQKAQAIIANSEGMQRRGVDQTGNGTVEDALGVDVSCPT